MITRSKKLTVLAVTALGGGIAAVAFTGAAQGSRIVGFGGATHDKVSQRIDQAFDAASDAAANKAIVIAAARKGDLQAKRCADQRWPSVSMDCLVTAGSPRPVSRTVTVEYRTGAQSSMLVRMPLEVVASR